MWLTVREVCELYKLKKSTVYLWAHDGSIPAYKVNGLLRFKQEEVDGWFESHKIVPLEIQVMPHKVAAPLIYGYNIRREASPRPKSQKGGFDGNL